MGPAMLVGSGAGAVLSARLPSRLLLALFAVLALGAALLMLLPRAGPDDEAAPAATTYPVSLAISVPLLLGGLLGMVGQGGAFILIPFMIYLLGGSPIAQSLLGSFFHDRRVGGSSSRDRSRRAGPARWRIGAGVPLAACGGKVPAAFSLPLADHRRNGSPDLA
jgi:hypothetical protein